MALVCDFKSKPSTVESKPENMEDLEDGEIEDGEIEDDDECIQGQTPVENPAPVIVQPKQEEIKAEKIDRDKPRDRERREKRHKDKDNRHMTEAEKSILHLRRKERMDREREKWVRRKEHQSIEPQDDFAIKLEKTLASILKKDRVTSDEDKEEERRGSKRKRKDKEGEHSAKHHKVNTPPSEEMDEKEMLNVRGGSLEPPRLDKDERPKSPRSEISYDSEYSSDHGKHEEKTNRGRRENRREGKKNNKNKNKNRDRNFKKEKSRESKVEPTDSKGICIFYLNGKCNKNDCIYSHEAVPPMKLELCKFYLMDCCAKGDNCSYMHSDFPCKFYHMGLPCNMGDQCKFAHGDPLSDGLKQILFKHIETAPRDILGGFPRLSREETLQMMDNTQQNLMELYKEQNPTEQQEKISKEGVDGLIPSLFDISVPVPAELKEEPADSKTKSSEKSGRKNKPSRWQAAEPKEKISNAAMNFGPFNFTQDQDMRINSNGDIDMRTLPPHPQSSLPQPLPSSLQSSDLSRVKANPLRNSSGDVDIRNMSPNFASDVDIRLQSTFEARGKGQAEQPSPFLGSKDVDIRQLGRPPSMIKKEENKTVPDQNKTSDSDPSINIPPNLPKMQRELYLRIQSQQRENPPVLNRDYEDSGGDDLNNDEDWYSDDDDEHRLTIKVDNEDGETAEQKEEKTEAVEFPCLPSINPIAAKPQEVVEKLGDLSKINITADITKLLSSLSSLPTPAPLLPDVATSRDPRQVKNQGGTINSPSRSPTATDSTTSLAPKTLFDPRLGHDQKLNQASEAPIRDPRRGVSAVTSTRSEKMSIYEQGGLNLDDTEASDAFKASSRPDVDLRTLGLPFKGMDSYTPATEIDASFSTHLPIAWKVVEVEVPRPDYSGLKLSLDEAEKTGDPRLRKIFRLSVEERDTPMSPKASPQRPTTVRIDPRLRKAEEAKSLNPASDTMNYMQQLNTLQSSAFYQSLTSNQKLMLNQELASRSDQTGSHDPILNSILANLNLLPNITGGASNVQQPGHGANFGVAANILQSINKMTAMSQMGPNMMNPNNPMLSSMVQPGLLGAAPGIPNMPQQDFPMNFDPRNQNSLLGNGPPQQFSNFEPPPGQGGFQNYPSDDFYPSDNQGNFRGNQGRNDRGGGSFNNRERRRGGRNNFGRNPGNRNQFRRNQGGSSRSNKGHNQS